MRFKITSVPFVVMFIALALGIAWGFSAGQGMSYTATNADTTDFVCTSTCPANSNQLMTQAQFQSNYNHTGTCGSGSTTQIVDYTVAMACKSGGGSGTLHSPIVANNTFSAGSFTSWTADTSTYVSCSTDGGVGGVNAADSDSDNGYASGSTGTASTGCFSSDGGTATMGFSQTFTISGTPTSQSVSFAYNAPLTTAGGSGGCVSDSGSVSNLTVKLNGTAVSTTTSPVIDSTWHTVTTTGTITALVNGSNTIDITAQVSGAHGTNYNAPSLDCSTQVRQAQRFNIDNIKVSATY